MLKMPHALEQNNLTEFLKYYSKCGEEGNKSITILHDVKVSLTLQRNVKQD